MEITTVSVKFSRRLDLGYPPYIQYLKALNGKPVPFGTRDNSNLEMDLYISATVGVDEDPDEAAKLLLLKARSILDQNLGIMAPTVLDEVVDPEAFIVDKTEITRVKADF